MEYLKITFTGGGSVLWSPKLITDLMHEDSLSGSEIVLFDIDLSAAEKVKAAVERWAKDNHKDFRFVATDKPEIAYRDADFVLVTISTGGLAAMRHDVELPDRYGIYQTTGDSVGPGGWSRTLRNVPIFAKMAQTIERLSPHAVVLNYSNPMGALTKVIADTTHLRHCGLCHGPFGTMHYLAKLLGVEISRIKARFGGINHLFWITDFTVDGQDGYGLLREKLNGRPLYAFDKSSPGGIMNGDHRVLTELYENFGMLTYIADDHTGEFFGCFLRDPKRMEELLIHRKTIAGREEKYAEGCRKLTDITAGNVPMGERSAEIAVNIIRAFVTHTQITDVVNLKNMGQISNLPTGAVVETLGVIDPCGFTPCVVGNLPDKIASLLSTHCRIQLMTTEAALTGNRELALEALCLDPLSQHLLPSQIRKMGLELIAANHAFLPRFS